MPQSPTGASDAAPVSWQPSAGLVPASLNHEQPTTGCVVRLELSGKGHANYPPSEHDLWRDEPGPRLL